MQPQPVPKHPTLGIPLLEGRQDPRPNCGAICRPGATEGDGLPEEEKRREGGGVAEARGGGEGVGRGGERKVGAGSDLGQPNLSVCECE